MDKHVAITIKVVATILAMFGVLYVLIMLAPVFATLLIALFIALAVEPAILYFTNFVILNKPMPRAVSVALTYILLILAISLIVSLGFSPVLSQSQKFLLSLANLIENHPFVEQYDLKVDQLLPEISRITETLLNTILSAFSNIFGVISVLILSIYISLDWENLKKRLRSMFKGRLREFVSDTVDEIEVKVGTWVKGQLILMFFVGLISFFGLLVIGIDYPLALGLIAGLLEVVPLMGPIIAAFFAAIVGFSVSPAEGLAAVALFILIQQLENSFLVPKVMGKVSGFSSLFVLVAVLVGGNFFGPIGVILAVPIMMCLTIIFKKVLDYSSGK